ncbi:MAG: ABC transporter ATP-binding protein [Thermoproteota archaeon]
MIEISQLSRHFGKKVAVDNVTLNVESGRILGLLGPNGAGKTTTLRLLATLIKPSSGTAYVDGFNITREAERVRSIVGIVTENQALYENLTVYQNLDFSGRMYHVPSQRRAERIRELLGLYELWEQRFSKVGRLSKGLRQRVVIARALIHDPRVLLLDEPTANLDLQTSMKTRKLLSDQTENDGKTVIISTHNIREAEKLCDEIAVMHEGRILAKGKACDLIKLVDNKHVLELKVRDISSTQKEALEKLFCTNDVGFRSNVITISLKDCDADAPRAIKQVIELGIEVLEARRADPELEDIVLRIIGGMKIAK